MKALQHDQHVEILEKLRERWLFIAVPSWSLSLWLFLSILTTNWIGEYGLSAAALIVLLKILLFLIPLFIRSATKKQWTILITFADLTIFAIITSYIWYWDRGMPIEDHSIAEFFSLVGNAFLFTIILFPLLLIEGINSIVHIPNLLIPYITGSIAIYWICMMLIVLYASKARRIFQLSISAILLFVIVLTMIGSRSIHSLL